MARSETKITNGILTTGNALDNNASEISLALATVKLGQHDHGKLQRARIKSENIIDKLINMRSKVQETKF